MRQNERLVGLAHLNDVAEVQPRELPGGPPAAEDYPAAVARPVMPGLGKFAVARKLLVFARPQIQEVQVAVGPKGGKAAGKGAHKGGKS